MAGKQDDWNKEIIDMTNLFGTDGIRARIGTCPLQPHELIQLGHAIAQWIITTYGTHSSCIIGTDSRESGDCISALLKSSLLQYQLQIFDVGVLPTPAFLYYVQNHPYISCALIISASHNRYHDNGIKIVDATGKLSLQAEQEISLLTHTANKDNKFGTHFGSSTYLIDAQQEYASMLQQKATAISLPNKKIIIDCANGATSAIASAIVQATGSQVIALNCSPNGRNINDECGSTNIHALQNAMSFYKADIGFSFDGDGDRIGVVSSNGTVLNGDDILVLLAQNRTYAQQSAIVGTIMSNQGLQVWLNARNQELVRTNVGDKNIANAMKEHQLLLGGEPSGHILMGDYMPMSDGIATALQILQTLTITNNWDLETFQKFPQFSKNIPVKEKKNLEQEPIAPLIAATKNRLPNGRLVVRYSGTESLLRIMAEGEHAQETENIVSQLSEQLYRLLN